MTHEKILNHINEKLAGHHLTLDNKAVTDEYNKVKTAWDKNLKDIKRPIKYVIIGEATVSYDNYFYNRKGDTTSFLNPKHFGCKNKNELIDFFFKNDVLVFDLYPLTLSTFIYDNIKFDCSNKEYKEGIENYFNNLKKLINIDTKIILRYAKLYSTKIKKGKEVIEKRCEFEILMNYIGRETSCVMPIYSSNMSACEIKIKDVFKSIISSKK
jgi:hypothetical protein